jgi:hypothetical protein
MTRRQSDLLFERTPSQVRRRALAKMEKAAKLLEDAYKLLLLPAMNQESDQEIAGLIQDAAWKIGDALKLVG